jgi:hypothetical protein
MEEEVMTAIREANKDSFSAPPSEISSPSSDTMTPSPPQDQPLASRATASSSDASAILSIQRMRNCVTVVVVLVTLQIYLFGGILLSFLTNASLLLLLILPLVRQTQRKQTLMASSPSSFSGRPAQKQERRQQAMYKLKIEYNPTPQAAFQTGHDMLTSHLCLQAMIQTISMFPELRGVTELPTIRFVDESFSKHDREEGSDSNLTTSMNNICDLKNIFELSLEEIVSLTAVSPPSLTSPKASSPQCGCCGIHWYQLIPFSLRELLESHLPPSLFHLSNSPTATQRHSFPLADVTAIDPFPKSIIDYSFIPTPCSLSHAPIHTLVTNLPLTSGMRRRRRFIYLTVCFSCSNSSSSMYLSPSAQEKFVKLLKDSFISLLWSLDETRKSSLSSSGVGGVGPDRVVNC